MCCPESQRRGKRWVKDKFVHSLLLCGLEAKMEVQEVTAKKFFLFPI